MNDTQEIPVTRKRRPLRWVLRGLLVLIFLAIAGVAGWIATGPHSVPWLKERILAKLNAHPELYRVTIEDVVVQFDGWDKPIGIHANQTDVILPDGQLFTSINDIYFGLDYGALLVGDVELSTIHVDSSSIYLYKSQEGQLMVGNNEQATERSIPLAALFAIGGDSGKQKSGGLGMRPDIYIENAKLRLFSASHNQTLDVTEAAIALMSEEDGYDLNAQFPIAFDQRFTINATGKINDFTGEMDIRLGFNNMPGEFVCSWVSLCEQFIPQDVVLKGRLDVKRPQGAQTPALAYHMMIEQGAMEIPEWYDAPLPIEALEMQGKLNIAEEVYTLESMSGKVGSFTVVNLSGAVDARTEPPTMALQGELANMPVNDLEKYWPKVYAPGSREWATTRVRDGVVPKATIEMLVKPEHHQGEFFPSDILKAVVEVDGANLVAVETMPKITDVKGTLYFTGDSMRVEGESGKLDGLNVSKINLAMPNLNAPAVPTNASFELSGDMPAALNVLKAKAFSFDDDWGLDAAKATGTAQAQLAIEFDAFSDSEGNGNNVNWDAVKYDVKATLSEVAYPNFKDMVNIAGFNAEIAASNSSTELKGKGLANGTPLEVSLKDSDKTAPTYTVKGTVPSSMLAQFDMDVSEYVNGPLAVDATITDGAVFPTINAKIDARNAELRIDDLKWQKPRGQQANLTLKGKPQGKRVIVDYDLSTASLNSKGQAQLDAKTSELSEVAINSLRLGETDLTGKYQVLENGDYVELRGRSLDLRPFLEGDDVDSGEPFSISNFPPLHLVLGIERVMMANGQNLRDVNGKLFCTTERCNSADINAGINNNAQMRLQIRKAEGEVPRQLNLKISDAGAFLKSLDMVTSMQGGEMSLTGSYDDAKQGHPMTGRFIISDFVLKDAPVLGKILNLGSLSGMLDTLQGKGLAFEKLSADLHFVNDKATVKEALMRGSSIGVTANGITHLDSGKMDIRGTVIPAYSVNSLVGEIPIVGELIAGGEGQGLVGVNYSVSNTYRDPKIGVNPLSAFTPGFLRNIFSVFEGTPQEAEEGAEGKYTPRSAPKQP